MRDSEIKNTVEHEGSIAMPRESKIAIAEKVRIAREYAAGNISREDAARQAGVVSDVITDWARIYRREGTLIGDGFSCCIGCLDKAPCRIVCIGSGITCRVGLRFQFVISVIGVGGDTTCRFCRCQSIACRVIGVFRRVP